MAKAKNDAALKKRLKDEAKIAPLRVIEQPPIENFYTDRILTLEAFEKFISTQFNFRDEEWHRFFRSDYIGDRPYSMAVATLPHSEHVEALRPYADFMKIMYPNWDGERGKVGLARGMWDETTWRLFREVLRFMSYMELLTTKARDEFATSGKPLWAPGPHRTHLSFEREQLPYLATVWEKFRVWPNPAHFLHISPADRKFVRFFDEKALEKDVPIETTVSKYFKRFFPQLSDVMLREIADLHKHECVEDGIVFLTKYEDIAAAYHDGPSSCMSYHPLQYGGHVTPHAVYADAPGVKLAVLRADGQGDTKWAARAFVFDAPDGSKRMIRNYGSSLLATKLMRKGYVTGNWQGAKLNKIKALDRDGKEIPDTWISAYLDGMGKGPDNGCQCVATCDEWDYWLAGSETFCNNAVRGNKTGLVLAWTRTQGLVGAWEGYNRRRHTVSRANIDGRIFDAGGLSKTKPNRAGEVACYQCGTATEAPYRHTLFVDSMKVEHQLCIACQASERSSSYLQIGDRNGSPVWGRVEYLCGIPMSGDGEFVSGNDLQYRRKELGVTLRLVHSDDMPALGFIQLTPRFYGAEAMAWHRKTDAFVETPDGWVKKKDLKTTVLGGVGHKDGLFFLGQNFTEELQYFPIDDVEIRKALTLGRFYVVGNKIAYIADGTFRPEQRKDIFARISEFAEDDDDDQTSQWLEQVPLADFINVIGAEVAATFYGDRKVEGSAGMQSFIITHVSMRIRSLLPRVSESFLVKVVTSFIGLNMDRFAGLDGIANIVPQLQDAFYQATRPIGEAFTDEPRPRPPSARPSTFHTYISAI